MKYVLLPNPIYVVDETSGITNTITGEFISKNDKEITIPLYGYNVTNSFEWFVLLGKLNIVLPNGLYSRIKDISIREVTNFPSEKYRYLVQTKEPIIVFNKYALLLGFTIPGHTHVAISELGELIDVVTQSIIRSPNGYELYAIKDYKVYNFGSNRQNSFYIHKLITSAWLWNDDPSTKYQINHKDLNKLNNRISNLEWISALDNMKHLYQTADYLNNVTCKIRNKQTGEIKEYLSISDMARDIGIPNYSKTKFLSMKQGFLYNGYEVRVTGDDREWFYSVLENVDIPKWANRQFNVYDKGEFVKSFYTSHDLCTYFGRASRVPMEELQRLLSKTHPDIRIDVKTFNKRDNVQAMNIITKEMVTKESISDLVKYTGCNESAIGTRVRMNKDNLRSGDWVFRYATEEPWVIEDSTLSTPARQVSRRIKVTNIYNNEVTYFDAINEAEAKLNITRKTIRNKLETKGLFNNMLRFEDAE
jgi:hypothetical protein